WSADLTAPVADRAMLHADNAYFIPAMRITSHRLRTNTASATAFRGFGGPQGILGIERVIDHAAHHLGLDPLTLRQRNFYAPDGTQETHYGQKVEGFVLPDMVTQLQKVAQVAARVFGIEAEAVKITATDTQKVPNTSATAASSGSDLNGMAAKLACEAIRTRMVGFLAEKHGVHPENIAFDSGNVQIGNQQISFAEAAQECYLGRVSLSSTGFYKTPDLSWDRSQGKGRPFFYFANGAALTEVVLDTLTGEYRLLRSDILHDVGTSLNPALDIGQIEGGYIQGVGWLTTEELIWDDQGRLATHAPSTYKIPTASDAPDVFNVSLWDAPNPFDTIYRSKAVGEPPFVLGISAFMALSDAAAACGSGYPALDAPATFERMRAAVRRQAQ
ncbi:MAG: molybdopterin-dependent oxidoreductase, partial [Maritimibacter sp.]